MYELQGHDTVDLNMQLPLARMSITGFVPVSCSAPSEGTLQKAE